MKREFETALRAGNVEAIENCLAQGCQIDSLDRYGQTPLMLVVISGVLEAAELLLAHSPDLDRTAKFNLTALMLAIVREKKDIARALIMAGADPTVEGTGAPGFRGKTALDLARERQEEELVRLLGGGDLRSTSGL